MRRTLQDDRRDNWMLDVPTVRAPCCKLWMPPFAIVELEGWESDILSEGRSSRLDWACGACLATCTAEAISPASDPDTPWGDNEPANGVRAERELKLTCCDWTQTLDAPLDEPLKLLWRDYRQALRDITVTFARPEDVVWPTPPTS